MGSPSAGGRGLKLIGAEADISGGGRPPREGVD